MSALMAVTSVAVRARRGITGHSAHELVAALSTRASPEPAPMPGGMRARYDVAEDAVEGWPCCG